MKCNLHHHHFISGEKQFSCNSTWFDNLFKTHCRQKQLPQLVVTLLKWDSNTGVFLWNLLSFYERLYWTTFALLYSMVLGVIAYKCCITKNKNLKLSLPRNRKICLCEEHFEESSFSKSVDLGRRLMNIKD